MSRNFGYGPGWLKRRAIVFHTGSRKGSESVFMADAYAMGKALAEGGYKALGYGGGQAGTMGAVAQGAHDSGARIISVTLPFFEAAQGAAIGDDRMIVVDTMHGRMDELRTGNVAGAAIVRPGSYGTMEELLEWLFQKNHILKPQIISNFQGYWDHLLKFIDASIDRSLTPVSIKNRFHVAASNDEVVDILNFYNSWYAPYEDHAFAGFDNRDDNFVKQTRHALIVQPAPLDVMYRLLSRVVSYDLSNILGQTVFNDPEGIVRPLILVNEGGYYDDFMKQMDVIFAAGFSPEDRRRLFYYADTQKEAEEIAGDLDNKPSLTPADLKAKHAEALPDSPAVG